MSYRDLSPDQVCAEARRSYLLDAEFHQEVDLAVSVWWLAVPPVVLREYRRMVVEPVAVACWLTCQRVAELASADT